MRSSFEKKAYSNIQIQKQVILLPSLPLLILVSGGEIDGVAGLFGRETTHNDGIPTRPHNSTKSFSKSPVGLYFSKKKIKVKKLKH